MRPDEELVWFLAWVNWQSKWTKCSNFKSQNSQLVSEFIIKSFLIEGSCLMLMQNSAEMTVGTRR